MSGRWRIVAFASAAVLVAAAAGYSWLCAARYEEISDRVLFGDIAELNLMIDDQSLPEATRQDCRTVKDLLLKGDRARVERVRTSMMTSARLDALKAELAAVALGLFSLALLALAVYFVVRRAKADSPEVPIGQRIQKARETECLSQREFGKITGTNQTFVSRVENGVNDPNTKMLLWLAQHEARMSAQKRLGVTPAQK